MRRIPLVVATGEAMEGIGVAVAAQARALDALALALNALGDAR